MFTIKYSEICEANFKAPPENGASSDRVLIAN